MKCSNDRSRQSHPKWRFVKPAAVPDPKPPGSLDQDRPKWWQTPRPPLFLCFLSVLFLKCALILPDSFFLSLKGLKPDGPEGQTLKQPGHLILWAVFL